MKEYKESKYFKKDKETTVEDIITNMAFSLFCAHLNLDYSIFGDGVVELFTHYRETKFSTLTIVIDYMTTLEDVVDES